MDPESEACHARREQLTRELAGLLLGVFQRALEAGSPRRGARRFVLRCALASFREGLGLAPARAYARALEEQDPAAVARALGLLFAPLDPIALDAEQLAALRDAAARDWSRANPLLLGSLFQASLERGARHAQGAHYTREADVQRVVQPTIVKPLLQRLAATERFAELEAVRRELRELKVLDPACGSGNFLYEAFRALLRLELAVLARMHAEFPAEARARAGPPSLSARQLFGIDRDAEAVELARATLGLARELARSRVRAWYAAEGLPAPPHLDAPLPEDGLAAHLRCDDALFCAWPPADRVIGNPPFLSKNAMQQELGPAYLRRLRRRYPQVPGRADYCVYWFRRAHEELPESGRAGLVGTNTIRQTYSRQGGLDFIVSTGGVIVEAVSSQVWPGDAQVHVSIVNWVKGGEPPGQRLLWRQRGTTADAPWEVRRLARINSALSGERDTSDARALAANRRPKRDFQGQTPGHEAFLLPRVQAEALIAADPRLGEVLHPFLTTTDLLEQPDGRATRFVIDFGQRTQDEAASYEPLYRRLEEAVLPVRQRKAAAEAERNALLRAEDPSARANQHHAGFLRRWWRLSYGRAAMLRALAPLSRYLVMGRVGIRPVFAFVAPAVRPMDLLQVFAVEDDYSFGVLSSRLHREWMLERCSSLGVAPRYTSETVFRSFPWPQEPTAAATREVAAAAREVQGLRDARGAGVSLARLYEGLDGQAEHPLRRAHARLDAAVEGAYGIPAGASAMELLLELNLALGEADAVVGPGVPSTLPEAERAALLSTFSVGA